MERASPSECNYSTSSQDLKQAWGNFLSSLSSWDWFVTMTLRDPPANRYGWDRPGWASAKRAFRGLVDLARPPLGDLAYVRMFEIQKDRGVPHIHALVGQTDPSVRRMDLVDWAYNRWGITRVEQYDARKGAAFYLCKYITKEVADIEFSRNIQSSMRAGRVPL